MANVAWSPIMTADEKGKVTTVPVGESVTASKLNIDDEEFELLKASGVVRDKKYPKDLQEGESPREYTIRRLADMVKEAQETAFAEMPDFMTELDIAAEHATPTAADAVEVTPSK